MNYQILMCNDDSNTKYKHYNGILYPFESVDDNYYNEYINNPENNNYTLPQNPNTTKIEYLRMEVKASMNHLIKIDCSDYPKEEKKFDHSNRNLQYWGWSWYGDDFCGGSSSYW